MKKINMEMLKKYVHHNWEDIRQADADPYYFVKIGDMQKAESDIQFELSVAIPEDLKTFYQEIGFGFLCFHLKQKKGLYRVLSPEELLDLYFEPDDEEMSDDEEMVDEFITYREWAWKNLEENNLLAFCLFGEEDSLLYIGVLDNAVYYLSSTYKIANSLGEFLELLDDEVDYFFKRVK